MDKVNTKVVSMDYPFPDTKSLEIQLLAELISDSSIMSEVVKILNESVFSDEQCRRLWLSMQDRYHKRLTIDLTTALMMTDKDFLVNEIIPATCGRYASAMDILEHASILRMSAANRTAYISAMEILRLASSGMQYSEILAASEKLCSDVKGFLCEGVKSSAIADIVNELADDIEKTQVDHESGRLTRVPTGFPTLDILTYSGFAPGNLVILAARPSVGKTAVMLQMAKTASAAGFTPSVFNIEMGNKELAQRMLVGTGYVSQSQIAHGNVDWSEMERAIQEVSSARMHLYDDRAKVEEIATQIVLNHRQGCCDIAFIDYLGLMTTSDKRPLYQVISDITKRLKQLAKSCEIPIVLLCQLNRASAIENRPPQLSDLRDSGSIEQDADIVLMLEREGEIEDTRRHIDMWVRKNRQGKAGNIYIQLDADESFNNFTDGGLRTPDEPQR